jgi:hypothetical protein
MDILYGEFVKVADSKKEVGDDDLKELASKYQPEVVG